MYITQTIDTRQKLLTYTAPFERPVFVALLGFFVALVLTIRFTSWVHEKGGGAVAASDLFDFQRAVWFSLSAMFQQSQWKLNCRSHNCS